MKDIFLVLVASISFFAVKAQDKIITIQKDTIECKIILVNADRISFEQKTTNNQVIGKSIAVSEVLEYLRSENNELSGANIRSKMKSKPEYRFLISAQGGFSHSLTDFSSSNNVLTSAGIPASVANDYTNNLKNGAYFNAGFHYLLTKPIGIGAEYTFFCSSSEKEFLANRLIGQNITVYTTPKLHENIYSNFVGISALLQQFLGAEHKIRLIETVTPGVVFFRNESRSFGILDYEQYQYGTYNLVFQHYNHSNSLTQGKAFGLKGSLSVEYLINSRLSAGISGNYLWSNLHKISTKKINLGSENQELTEAVDISHIDFGVSVRYSF